MVPCHPYLHLIMALGLSGCAVEAEAGWADDLEDSIADRTAVFHSSQELLNHSFAPPGSEILAGDELLYGVCLDIGETRKTWYLKMRVLDVQTKRWMNYRQLWDFEAKVQPGAARRAALREAALASHAQQKTKQFDFDSLASEMQIARILVEAFDANGKSLGSAESETTVKQLSEGLVPACEAGYAHREVMRGRVALGRDADMLELDKQQYDDVKTVARGVSACRRFFKILQSNPVTKNILFEVIALPTLWSVITNLGVDVAFEIDFFGARPLARGRYPSSDRELWSTPLSLRLNDQPALLTRIIAGPSDSPNATAAGVFAVEGRHPSDPNRRVHVQLLGSRRETDVAGH